MEEKKIFSSFRDPSGFVFFKKGVIYRQINKIYQPDFERLENSGLLKELTDNHLLVRHEETGETALEPEKAYKILKPARVPFLSYPYEWCFSQLKEAALLTLEIQKRALARNLSLKDASAYNIQFIKGKPLLIDILSFERYKENQPWVAYRQFCQHFLAPLTLIVYRDGRLNLLSRLFIDGLPLDLASSLLPKKTYLKFSVLSHIHFHARSQKYYADKRIRSQTRKMSLFALKNLVLSLESAVKSLNWPAKGTEWAEYYDHTNYTASGFEDKKRIVDSFIQLINPALVWDLGANNGVFSRLAAKRGAYVIASDIDPAAVEKGYQFVRQNKERNILPLIIDLTNPSPGIGWQNKERTSFINRGPADLVMALALIHHLAISNNTPFSQMANFFAKIGRSLIIEYVPKEDSQVKILLATREDVFKEYNQKNFEDEFSKYFNIKQKFQIEDSQRVIYLMKKKS